MTGRRVGCRSPSVPRFAQPPLLPPPAGRDGVAPARPSSLSWQGPHLALARADPSRAVSAGGHPVGHRQTRGLVSFNGHKGVFSMASTKRPEVVVVTGASAGVGRATVRAFAGQGAHVGLLA